MTDFDNQNEMSVVELPAPTLVVSRSILARTHEYFFPYWQAGVETACFWFGIDAGDVQIVTTVVAPKLFQTRGNYAINRSGWPRIVRSMRQQKLTNLAQIHTHPIDYGVDHSPYDDDHAYSTQLGSLSIVFADYGRSTAYDLENVGVHERKSGGWSRLSEAEISIRLRLVDDFADFRWGIQSGGILDDE